MARLLRVVENAELSYIAQCATITGELPQGFHHLRHETVIGQGDEDFARASEGLRTWQAHRLPGIRVFPTDAPLRTGATVIVTLGTGFAAIVAPCRIIGVVEEPGRFGFAYGTLPGHPESGEEAFMATIGDDGTVRFEIRAFSRPGDALTRAAGPVGRGMQSVATKGYLRAMRRYVARSRSAGRR